MSCSVSSSHTRTCIAFPSLHQWNISSILVISHKSRKCEIVNLVFVCYDILKIHSLSRGYTTENSCNDKFPVTSLLVWNTSTHFKLFLLFIYFHKPSHDTQSENKYLSKTLKILYNLKLYKNETSIRQRVITHF
jgi:hypothetical protein